MRTYLQVAFALALAGSLAACGSHNSQNDTTQGTPTQPAASPMDETSAAPGGAAVDTSAPGTGEESASTAETANPTASPEAGASPATVANGQCPLLSNDQVGEVMHLTVSSVKVGHDGGQCDFLFKENAYIGLSIEYSSQGGPREVTSLREASNVVTGVMGGIAKAVGASPVPGLTTQATPPPDVAKVGDDQVFSTPGMDTIFAASKDDAYAEVTGSIFPDGVSRWVALPELARRVLAAH